MGKRMIFTLSIFLILVLAWTPWLSKQIATQMVSERFISRWDDKYWGCGFQCNYCAIDEPKKVPFGYQVTVKYACGSTHSAKHLFLSFIGAIWGF